MSQIIKKLALIMAIYASTTMASKEFDLLLKHVQCIHYLLHFKRNKGDIEVLINFGSEVNAMTLTYTAILGLKVWPTNVGI